MPTVGSSRARLARLHAAFAAVVLVLSCAQAAGASGLAHAAPVQARWVLTDLGTLAGEGGTSFASGINNKGQVVGTSTTKDGSSHAFLWEKGRMRDLGTLPGLRAGSRAAAINDRGQIAGSGWATDPASSHAVLWENGTARDLGTLGGKDSYATAINNRGQVVGVSETKAGTRHAFLWTDGKMRDLGAFDPAAINDRGQVVGSGPTPGASSWNRRWRARLWEKGTLRVLGQKRQQALASGIDERGRIVGTVGWRLATWTRATPSGTFREVRLRPSVGGNHDIESRASSNERGQIAATGIREAYVWENGRRHVLPALPGGQRSVATAINDRGLVVGASGRAHHFEADRAVLWTPRAAG